MKTFTRIVATLLGAGSLTLSTHALETETKIARAAGRAFLPSLSIQKCAQRAANAPPTITIVAFGTERLTDRHSSLS